MSLDKIFSACSLSKMIGCRLAGPFDLLFNAQQFLSYIIHCLTLSFCSHTPHNQHTKKTVALPGALDATDQ